MLKVWVLIIALSTPNGWGGMNQATITKEYFEKKEECMKMKEYIKSRWDGFGNKALVECLETLLIEKEKFYVK